jgi:hypothetical protein
VNAVMLAEPQFMHWSEAANHLGTRRSSATDAQPWRICSGPGPRHML